MLRHSLATLRAEIYCGTLWLPLSSSFFFFCLFGLNDCLPARAKRGMAIRSLRPKRAKKSWGLLGREEVVIKNQRVITTKRFCYLVGGHLFLWSTLDSKPTKTNKNKQDLAESLNLMLTIHVSFWPDNASLQSILAHPILCQNFVLFSSWFPSFFSN